jgi:hypothetical protein
VAEYLKRTSGLSAEKQSQESNESQIEPFRPGELAWSTMSMKSDFSAVILICGVKPAQQGGFALGLTGQIAAS